MEHLLAVHLDNLALRVHQVLRVLKETLVHKEIWGHRVL
jgi:hypothetical protein